MSKEDLKTNIKNRDTTEYDDCESEEYINAKFKVSVERAIEDLYFKSCSLDVSYKDFVSIVLSSLIIVHYRDMKKGHKPVLI